jgi:hypothetical protein
LHDTVEDTDVEVADIEARFGHDIAAAVNGLSNPSKLSDGNRRIRHEIDLRHFAQGNEIVKTVRMADIIDNVISVVYQNPGYAPKYMKEKTDYVEIAHEADPRIRQRATTILLDMPAALPNSPFRKALRKFNEENPVQQNVDLSPPNGNDAFTLPTFMISKS